MTSLKKLYHRWQTRRLVSAMQKQTARILQSVDTLVTDIRFHRQFKDLPSAVAHLKKSIHHMELALSALEKALPQCEVTFRQEALAQLKMAMLRLSIADTR